MSFLPSSGPAWRIVPGLHLAVQDWEHLLFMHWPIPPALLRPLVPDALDIELHDDSAWISLVVLTVQNATPAVGIPLPWLSFFHQVNVRTYVQRDGIPGLWIFSTDVDSGLMVPAARRFFHLAYCLASCHVALHGGVHEWSVIRKDAAAPSAELSLAWKPGDPLGVPQPGTAEFFLVERYCVYATDDEGRLYRARVSHQPWNLREGHVRRWETTLFGALGLPTPRQEPMVQYARVMPNVKIWPIEQISNTLPAVS